MIADLSKQCQIDVYRAGNRIDVKVTHLPTGMVETETDAKSQYLARERCLQRIAARLDSQPGAGP